MTRIADGQSMVYAVTMALTDDIVKAIHADGRTRYRIAQDSGVSAAILSRLVNGHRGVTIETAERLADALGHKIVMTPKARTGKVK
jgi:transcriptional regulator with XRE-family HTH domain